MKYDKVSIVGVVLCVLCFMGIFWYQRPQGAAKNSTQTPPVNVVQPQANETATSTETLPAETGSGQRSADAVKAQAPAPAPSQNKTPLSVYGPDKARRQPAVAQLQTLERTGELRVAIDTELGGITNIQLLKYAKDKTKAGVTEDRVELAHYDHPFMALSAAQTAEWGLLPAEKENVSATETSVQMTRLNGDGTLAVTERWELLPEKNYQISYTVTMENRSQMSREIPGLMVEGGALPPSVSGRKEDGGGAACMPYGEEQCRLLSVKDLAKIAQAYQTIQDPMALVGEKDKAQSKISGLLADRVSWVSIHSKYFLLSIWNENEKEPSRFDAFTCEPVPEAKPGKGQERYRAKLMMPGMAIAPGQQVQWKLAGYAGPKDPEILYALDNGLDGILGLDRFFWRASWMSWISRILLKCLVWMSRLFPEGSAFGWAVILLTVAVKVLFWPLSYKATLSMRKMQELKPQIDALKERYKNDPQMLYRKQQELMKNNQVSQLGGCMPMLCQIPVFFALYNTFRNAIDLRLAGFLWAHDLSMPDTVCQIGNLPLNPLALLMGVTMVLQQKMTPNADQQQAKMMMFMSVFFIYIFYSFPSALTLYMTVNQLLSILQTYLITKIDPKKAANNTIAAKA